MSNYHMRAALKFRFQHTWQVKDRQRRLRRGLLRRRTERYTLADYRKEGRAPRRISPDEIVGSAVKRAMDFGLSLLILIIISPVLGVIALLIKLDTPGPVFFVQLRSGLNGRPFRIFKFRTMHHDAPDNCQALYRDRRITRIGALLRYSSLDELPQLVNVLRGEMSFVGPRPHPLWLDAVMTAEIAEYTARFAVRPGLTGLAQVRGCRGETPRVSDMRKRVQHDLEYIRTWNCLLDVNIIMQTARVLIHKPSGS